MSFFEIKTNKNKINHGFFGEKKLRVCQPSKTNVLRKYQAHILYSMLKFNKQKKKINKMTIFKECYIKKIYIYNL